jgi:hypothetical protein
MLDDAKTEMKIGFQEKRGISWLAKQLSASHEGLGSTSQ